MVLSLLACSGEQPHVSDGVPDGMPLRLSGQMSIVIASPATGEGVAFTDAVATEISPFSLLDALPIPLRVVAGKKFASGSKVTVIWPPSSPIAPAGTAARQTLAACAASIVL